MGNANHVEKETDQPERKKERKNKIKGPVYAEIVSEEQSKSGVPPLKVLLHEQLTSSAIDSLRDSHAIANDLAKKLSLDILKEPETLGKFGQLLGYIFAYESVLYPTRLLIYWSIGTDVAFKNAIIQTKWQIGRWQRTVGPNQVNYLVRNLLQNDDIKKLSIKPLIKMVFEIEAVKQPLTNIIVDVLPHAQVEILL